MLVDVARQGRVTDVVDVAVFAVLRASTRCLRVAGLHYRPVISEETG